MGRKREKNLYWLGQAPVWKALLALSVPTVLSQIISVVYNIADTLFIGRLNDPGQVAAVTFALPLTIIFNAIANLFGVGGAALIAHRLGEGKREDAKKGAAFALYGGIFLALLYSIVIAAFNPLILPALGADGSTLDHVRNYVFYTVMLGSLPAVLNPLLAHLLRGEGNAFASSLGVALGGLLNIALDPLFIFAFKMEVAGAGLATFLSNVFATLFLLGCAIYKRKSTVLCFDIRKARCGLDIAKEVLVIGLPSSIVSLMASISNMVCNFLYSPYGDTIVAGWGIAKRIDLFAFALAQGMTQGALPLLSYCHASKQINRLKRGVALSFAYSMILGAFAGIALFLLARPLSLMFIDDETTVYYAATFTRILAVTCLTTPPSFMVISVFQALKLKWQPFVLSFFRKGIFTIGISVLFSFFLDEYGLAWATPVADFLAALLALGMFFFVWRKSLRNLKEEEPQLLGN